MASSHYVLYDIPSGKALCVTWSPNPWKSHSAAFKFLRVAANTGTPAYSIPTIASPDGIYTMDSRNIVDHIERQAPLPSLHSDSVYLEKVERIWSQYMKAIKPIFIPLVPERILNTESLDYWYTSRAAMVGMSLGQLEREKGGVRAWNEAEPALREGTAFLKENEGPLFIGKTVSYVDLVWVSILLFNEKLGLDVFQEAMERTGDSQVHLKLMKAVQPWYG